MGVKILVSHIKGRMYAEHVRKQRAEEDLLGTKKRDTGGDWRKLYNEDLLLAKYH
jgi:hypothetical protein